jgi:Tfp pilus assembly protein PilN
MNEIDLFPDELRRQLMFTRWFKRAVFTLVGVTLVIGAAFAGLRQANSKIEEQIQYFQDQREITNTNRRQLGQLKQDKVDLQQQLNLLSGLRSGASAEKMFLMLDRALPGPEVWLTNWKFRRAGTQVEKIPETVNTGYFIVIPAGSSSRKEEIWKIETHMNIQGQALDHSAMSEFVLNLTQQPEIENVRIVNTRLNKSRGEKLVDFSLDIIVSVSERRA